MYVYIIRYALLRFDCKPFYVITILTNKHNIHTLKMSQLLLLQFKIYMQLASTQIEIICKATLNYVYCPVTSLFLTSVLFDAII